MKRRIQNLCRNCGEIGHEISRTEFFKRKIRELSDSVFRCVGIPGRKRKLGKFCGLDHVGLEVGESGEDFGVGRVGFVVLNGEVGELGDEGWVREEIWRRLGDEVEELLRGDSGGSGEEERE